MIILDVKNVNRVGMRHMKYTHKRFKAKWSTIIFSLLQHLKYKQKQSSVETFLIL